MAVPRVRQACRLARAACLWGSPRRQRGTPSAGWLSATSRKSSPTARGSRWPLPTPARRSNGIKPGKAPPPSPASQGPAGHGGSQAMTRSDLSPRPHPRTLRSSIHNVPFFAHQGGSAVLFVTGGTGLAQLLQTALGSGVISLVRSADNGFGRSGECLGLVQPVVAPPLPGRGACSSLPASAIRAASARTWSHGAGGPASPAVPGSARRAPGWAHSRPS